MHRLRRALWVAAVSTKLHVAPLPPDHKASPECWCAPIRSLSDEAGELWIHRRTPELVSLIADLTSFVVRNDAGECSWCEAEDPEKVTHHKAQCPWRLGVRIARGR